MGKKAICSLALIASLPILGGCASTTTKPPGAQPSMLDKVTTSVKNGTAAVTKAFTKKPTPGSETTLAGGGKGGPGVFVAMAEVNERSDNLDEAEEQYKKALEMDPNHLPALLGYAHLEDRRHNFEAAQKLYKRAMKKHSRDASVHNDQGLCYYHHGMLPEAAKSMQRAVELHQDRKLYRNNLATIYVDQGKNKEALAELTIAHGEAVAHYNMGFLLMKKEDKQAALAHFRQALEKDSSLTAAEQWIAQLSAPPSTVEPQPSQVAVVETAQRTDVVVEQGTTSAKFNVVEQAPTPGPTITDSQIVLRAGGTTEAPPYPTTVTPAPVVEKPSEPQAPPATRWPNRLRDSASDAAPKDSTRLPIVETPQG